MQQKLCIYSKKIDEVIEVFRVNSDRYNFLRSILEQEDLEIGELLHISKERLNRAIQKLLSKRDEQPLVDFGDRFEETQCHELLEFEGKMYKLATSGYENLLIFSINIYNNLDKGLKISLLLNS